MGDLKFKLSKRALKDGIVVYKCTKWLFTIGCVRVFPEGRLVISNNERRLEIINEAFEEQECG